MGQGRQLIRVADLEEDRPDPHFVILYTDSGIRDKKFFFHRASDGESGVKPTPTPVSGDKEVVQAFLRRFMTMCACLI